MAKRRRPKSRGRTTNVAWEMAFEAEVRQLSARQRAVLLRWLRRWGHWPQRIFWVMDPTGGWYPLM